MNRRLPWDHLALPALLLLAIALLWAGHTHGAPETITTAQHGPATTADCPTGQATPWPTPTRPRHPGR